MEHGVDQELAPLVMSDEQLQEDFKKIYEDMKTFRNNAYLWWQIVEFTYDDFMVRARTRG